MPIDAATVVWLLEGGGQAAPGDEAQRALAEWASAHGVTLEAPADTGPAAIAIDWSAGESVERSLAQVRDALAGLDFDAAERELAHAEEVLRAHPELPQAAWLGAEVERAWSVRWLRAGDEARAKGAWQRAAGLDGGRAAGLGETAFEAGAEITASIRLTGDVGSQSLRIDGVSALPGDVKRSEGEHAVAIVTSDGRVTWAEWVSLAQGVEVRIAAPESPACSRDAMARAKVEAGVVAGAGVRCGAWVAAVAGDAGAIQVATCEGGTCGPLVEWRARAVLAPVKPAPAPVAESRGKWPAWATWTLAGVGVVGASVAVAAAAGAFKGSPPPPETQWVNGGLAVHSF